jgi:alpha-glucosidase
MRRVVDEYPDRMLVGEVALQDLHRVVAYLATGDQLHLAHNFIFCDMPWDADGFRTSIDDFEALAPATAWPAWFLNNHDHSRVATRFDDGGLGAARARGTLLMLYALRATRSGRRFRGCRRPRPAPARDSRPGSPGCR